MQELQHLHQITKTPILFAVLMEYREAAVMLELIKYHKENYKYEDSERDNNFKKIEDDIESFLTDLLSKV